MLNDPRHLRGPAPPAARRAGRSSSPAPPSRAASATPPSGPATTSATGRPAATTPDARGPRPLRLPVRRRRHRRLRGGAARRSCSRAGCRSASSTRSCARTPRSARPTRSRGRTARHEAVNRRAIELRYELLPHVYNVMEEASRTGLPALRPLVLEYPDDGADVRDARTSSCSARDLLVAPVLREAQTAARGLPARGRLVRLLDGPARWAGGRWIEVPVTLDSIPIYVRGGAFVFRQPVVQHTGRDAGPAAHRGRLSGDDAGGGTLYEDDGETLDYTRGVFLRRRFAVARTGTAGRRRPWPPPRAPTGRPPAT